MVPRWRILNTPSDSTRVTCDTELRVSTTAGWVDIKFGTNVHCPLRMKYKTFGDTLAFRVVPSSAKNWANTWFYDQGPNECPINLICTLCFVPIGRCSGSSRCCGGQNFLVDVFQLPTSKCFMCMMPKVTKTLLKITRLCLLGKYTHNWTLSSASCGHMKLKNRRENASKPFMLEHFYTWENIVTFLLLDLYTNITLQIHPTSSPRVLPSQCDIRQLVIEESE